MSNKRKASSKRKSSARSKGSSRPSTHHAAPNAVRSKTSTPESSSDGKPQWDRLGLDGLDFKGLGLVQISTSDLLPYDSDPETGESDPAAPGPQSSHEPHGDAPELDTIGQNWTPFEGSTPIQPSGSHSGATVDGDVTGDAAPAAPGPQSSHEPHGDAPELDTIGQNWTHFEGSTPIQPSGSHSGATVDGDVTGDAAPATPGPQSDHELHGAAPELDTIGQNWTHFEGSTPIQPSESPSEASENGPAIVDIDPEESSKNPGETSLTERQRDALPSLAAFPNAAQAARAAGVSRATLYNWLQNDSFRAEITRLREAHVQLANEELQSLRMRASQVFREAMDQEKMSYRISAARYVTNVGLHLHDAEQLRKQMKNLRQALEQADL